MNLSPEARRHAASVLEDRGPTHVFARDKFVALLHSTLAFHTTAHYPAESPEMATVIGALTDEMIQRRSVTFGGKSIPIPVRLDESGKPVIDAVDAALLLCRLDGWDDDPSPTLWPQLHMTGHVRFIGLLVALRVGAPTHV